MSNEQLADSQSPIANSRKRPLLVPVFVVTLVFLLGALGGVWSQAALLPYLASHDSFRNARFVQEWNERTTVIQRTERVVVQENLALEQAVERSRKTAVAVQSVAGSRVVQGAGFLATTDGLVVTLASVVPPGSQHNVHQDTETGFLSVQVLKRDLKNNLALLQIDALGLQTAGFSGEPSPGKAAFLVGKAFQGTELNTFANQGIVKALAGDMFLTTMRESLPLNGAPVFDVTGRVLGLASLDGFGNVRVIPAAAVRAFLGF